MAVATQQLSSSSNGVGRFKIETTNGAMLAQSSIGSGSALVTSRSSSPSSTTPPSSPRSSSSAPCSRDSVASALDDYIAASTGGREAYTMGDVRTAIKHFNRALDIELQTELECLYDTSIGYMSGLVRSEVNSRLQQQQQQSSWDYSAKCERILKHLGTHFSEAMKGVSKKRTNPKWFLRMGAALVIVNEWEKAKVVYSEGINLCKNKKALKHALKSLIKLEQMTSYGDIPAEDQPSAGSPCVSPNTSPYPSPQPSPVHSPKISPRRDRSKSVAGNERKLRRDRVLSLSLEHTVNVEQARKSSAGEVVTPTSSLKIPTNKRSSFFFFGSKKVSTLTSHCTAAWRLLFEPESCLVLSHRDFQPSAITHMRSLSTLNYDDMCDGMEQDLNFKDDRSSGKFNSIKLTSLRIEDDDSELDDSD